jgi:LmbE family N-acetylglucosaminyl deacetylase
LIEVRQRVVATDRVMVLAPHPDDESVATGGALQVAVSVGADVRVVYVTDGEDNPWAQRATEHRWRISQRDRVRWGARRRREAVAALNCLGVPSSATRFLGFHDQHVTEALIGGTHAAVERLAEELAAWRPTVLFIPSLEDRHPDHSATGAMARLAVAQTPRDVCSQVFAYTVHRPAAAGSERCDALCVLSRSEREAKRRAILRHASQLRLRRSFLLRFADETETFSCGPLTMAGNHAAHPLQVLRTTGDQWSFAVLRPPRVALDRAALLLISQGDGEMNSLRVTLPRRAGCTPLRGPDGGSMVGEMQAHRDGAWLMVTITSPALCHADFRLAKLDLPLRRSVGLFDCWPWLSFGSVRVRAAQPPSESSSTGSQEPLATLVES